MQFGSTAYDWKVSRQVRVPPRRLARKGGRYDNIVAMATFLDVEPTIDNHWRALVLFGRNVASYKFALGRALLQLKEQGSDSVAIEDLATPYALGICEHLKLAPKQATSNSSRFLDACRSFNAGELGEDRLRDVTVQLGFNNVIDAFHRLGPADLERRFFVDERATSKSLRMTDDLLRASATSCGAQDLVLENEARWRLVETAWDLGISRSLIEFDSASQELGVRRRDGRVSVTSCRSALNGYQKGCCFYCFASISIEGVDVADVDHFFPWRLRGRLGRNLNGLWNLVLACPSCNRGQGGKSDLVPESDLLERLHAPQRVSNWQLDHPLRETLMAQTGIAAADRVAFLHECYDLAVQARIVCWSPVRRGLRRHFELGEILRRERAGVLQRHGRRRHARVARALPCTPPTRRVHSRRRLWVWT